MSDNQNNFVSEFGIFALLTEEKEKTKQKENIVNSSPKMSVCYSICKKNILLELFDVEQIKMNRVTISFLPLIIRLLFYLSRYFRKIMEIILIYLYLICYPYYF